MREQELKILKMERQEMNDTFIGANTGMSDTDYRVIEEMALKLAQVKVEREDLEKERARVEKEKTEEIEEIRREYEEQVKGLKE